MHKKRIAGGGGKNIKWMTSPRGSHNEKIPLIDIIRDQLGYADTAKEAKTIIRNGLVQVNKKVVKDYKHGVGFMDIIDIPGTKQHFRILVGSKGLYLKEIDEKESEIKLCRVNGKNIMSGGKVQLNFHDGTNAITSDKVNVNDTVMIDLKKDKVKEVLPYDKGNQVIIFNGKHSGVTGILTDIIEGTRSRKSLSMIDEIQTLTEYIIVIGKAKPLISI